MNHKLIIGLVLVFLIAFVLTIKLVFKIDFDGIMINLVSEIIGALITFGFIDYILDRNEKKSKQKLMRLAMIPIKRPIKIYLLMWFHIYSPDENETKKKLETMSLKDFLLSNDFLEKAKKKNFADSYSTFERDKSKLNINVIEALKEFKALINSSLDRNSIYFNAEITEILLHFGEKAYLYEIFKVWEDIYQSSTNNIWFNGIEKENIKAHLTEFIKLIDIYNKFAVNEDYIDNSTIFNFKKIEDKTNKW